MTKDACNNAFVDLDFPSFITPCQPRRGQHVAGGHGKSGFVCAFEVGFAVAEIDFTTPNLKESAGGKHH